MNNALRNMVKEQIVKRGVKNKKVIDAFLKVPREFFVPPNYKGVAYADAPLPIGYGQTISQPFIVVLMTELLDIEEDDRVLEIGTGSGYQTVILSLLSKEVYTMEAIRELKDIAEKRFNILGTNNIKN